MKQSASGVREHWQPGYEVCTFQVHMRRRDRDGRLKPIRSKSITIENVSIREALQILRLGIKAYKEMGQ